MSKNISKDGEKIREQLLINIKSRSDEKKIKFTKWCNAQSNVQNSILSLIEHSIDRFGYADITDHEIAKKLYMEILYFNKEEGIKFNDNEKEINHQPIDDEKSQLDSSKEQQSLSVEEKNLEEEIQKETENKKEIDADLGAF